MKNSLITVLLITSLIGAGGLLLVTEKANKLKTEIRKEHAKIDSISTSKNSLQNNFNIVQQKSDSMVVQVQNLKSDLKKQRALNAREIEKKNQELVEANKTSDHLQDQQNALNNQVNDLRKLSDQLKEENRSILTKLALLQESNLQLTNELSVTKLMSKDNVFIESLSSRGKPSAKGKKVKKIITGFSLGKDLQNPTYRIIGPGGEELPKDCGMFTLEKAADGTSSIKPKKFELTYFAAKKMTRGLYQIEVLNDNKHFGNFLVKFR